MDKILPIKAVPNSLRKVKEGENIIVHVPSGFKGIKSGTLLRGMVVSAEKGEVVVKTDLGSLILKSNLNYKPGTQLVIELFIKGKDLELKLYFPKLPSEEVTLQRSTEQLNHVNFKPINKASNTVGTTQIGKAFDISSELKLISAILVNVKNPSNILSNPGIFEGIKGAITDNYTGRVEDILDNGANFNFKVLRVSDHIESEEINVNDGKVILTGKIISDDKFNEAVLKTALGNFTFSNIELNLKDDIYVLLELMQINYPNTKASDLKLNDLSEILYFLESLENMPVKSLKTDFQHSDFLNADLFSPDNTLFTAALTRLFTGNVNNSDPTNKEELKLIEQIQTAAQFMFKESLSKMPWQVLITPIIYQKSINFLKFYIKKMPDSKQELIRRFVVEVSNSVIGKVVINGLFLKDKVVPRLYLNLKAEQVPEVGLEKEIRSLFQILTQAHGYEGNISFMILKDYISPMTKNIRSICLTKAKECMIGHLELNV